MKQIAGSRADAGRDAPAASTELSTCSTISWKVLCSSLRRSSHDN
jgi:hypothetical protein